MNYFKIEWMTTPAASLGMRFFRRYVRVEVPCLHDDGNCILFVKYFFLYANSIMFF